MEQETYTLLLVVMGLLLSLLVTFTVIATQSAYRNGVRDGYQNTWLPHIRKQVLEEELTQGPKVKKE